MHPPESTRQQQRLVWWVLWAAFQVGIFVIYKFVGMPQSPTHLSEPALWQMAFLPVLISVAIRWSLLPRMKDSVKALPWFVIGIAMAETTCFFGIFIFPSHQVQLFTACVIGIFQFIPIYYGRYFQGNGGD